MYKQRSPRQPIPTPLGNIWTRGGALAKAYSFFRGLVGSGGDNADWALKLAKAEQAGRQHNLRVVWQPDPEAEWDFVTDSPSAMNRCVYEHGGGHIRDQKGIAWGLWDDCPYARRKEILSACVIKLCRAHANYLYHSDAVDRCADCECLARLGGIDTPENGYGRLVAAELVYESICELAMRDAKATMRGRELIGRGV